MPIQNINATTLKNWLDTDDILLIDVREKWEYEAAAIPGATLVSLGTISKDTLPVLEGRKVVIYCRSGVRSVKAATLIETIYPDIVLNNLQGGILEWAANGNIIEQH